MILLFTDFGFDGPYVGQLKAVLQHAAPGVPVIDLMHDAPAFDPQSSAYVLASLCDRLPPGAIAVCVVDPGVGGARRAIVVEADGRRFVGPDNGLLAVIAGRAREASCRSVTWRPEDLSASFHGRDLFAPVAARLAKGEAVPGEAIPIGTIAPPDWPDDLSRIVYIDRYGNATTGLRAARIEPGAAIEISGRSFARARTFSDRPPGEAFWYANANGLAEIAVNRGSAADMLGIGIGAALSAPLLDATPPTAGAL